MRKRTTALLVAMSLAMAACGGGDGQADSGVTAVPEPTSAEDSGGGGTSSLSATYLDGEWCSSEGIGYSVDGESVKVDFGNSVLDSSIQQTFGNKTVVSQGDDQFVIEEAGEEVTFTRGTC